MQEKYLKQIPLKKTNKLSRTMKVSILMTFLSILSAMAENSFSQSESLTLKLTNVTIKQSIKEIEQSSDYLFLIMDDAEKELMKIVSINMDNKSINEILSLLLKNTQLSYSIVKRQVTIRKKISPADNRQPAETVQQTKKIIRGKITDTRGEAIIGANIIEKGTSSGTVTDIDGNFSLSVDNNATLVVSYIGYATQEINITTQNTLNIILSEDTGMLEELVVVGYGVQKKINTTGAISAMETKELIQSPVANISNSMVGRVPGLFAMQTSGEPGYDASKLMIRGTGTFSGNTDPLVLVDGIEVSNYNSIDPNEVETVNLLKDASSTAVYGIRGANGVIIITTKRGKAGPPKISYTFNQGFNSFTKLRESMNSVEYATHYNIAQIADQNVSGSYAPLRYSPYDIELYRNGSDPVFHPDKNWIKELFRSYAPQQQHNITFNGGQRNVRYFVSAGFFRQEGMFENFQELVDDYSPQSIFKRYNLRSNFNFDITPELNMLVDVSSQTEERSGNNHSSTQYLIGTIMRAAPLEGPGVIDGKIVNLPGLNTNPYKELLFPENTGGVRRWYQNFLNASARLNYKMDFIVKGITLRGNIAFQNYNSQTIVNNKRIIVYTAYRTPNGGVNLVPNSTAAPFGFYQSGNYNRRITLEGGLEYDRSFGKHSVTALALYNQQKTYSPDLAFYIPKGYQSYIGRVTYNFDNRYMAEFNVGYNGTENFAENKRFGLFPAYSLSWVPSNEPFFPKNQTITYIKIRASYGEVGNDNIGGARFLYRPTNYTQQSDMYYFGKVGSTYSGYPGVMEGATGNPNVTWEKAVKKNIGIDLKLLNDKLDVSADLWNEYRNNILAIPQTYSLVSGLRQPPTNLGIMENGGFESSITYSDAIRDFNYRISVNYSFARNKVIFRDEIKNAYPYQNVTGLRLGQPFFLISDGLYNTWEEVNDASRAVTDYINNKIQPGDVKIRDVNGDGLINFYDAVPMGHPETPEIIYGISLGASYKGIDLSLLFQGATNVSIMYTPFQREVGFGANPPQGAARYLLESWTPERYEQGLPIKFPRFGLNNNGDTGNTFLVDGSYLRLKNMEIGYTLDKKISDFLRITSCRIYINGNNLLTWDKLLPGIDPELRYTGGYTTENYPMTRTINVGCNINF